MGGNNIDSVVFTKKAYDNMGKKNKTKKKDFINICKMDQFQLKQYLGSKICDLYDDVYVGDGYIYAKGSIPFALTAHMDTVHAERVRDFYDYTTKNRDHIFSSPQGIGGDDRCGVYMILKILEAGFKPTVIFCEDEEIGLVGSGKLSKNTELMSELGKLNYIIELDRANATDAVFYDCDNPEFTKYILNKTGYEEEWGSCSDISRLAPASGIAAVNLSCGYYNPHTTSEYVSYAEMMHTVSVVKELLEDSESKRFEYIERVYTANNLSWNDYFYSERDGYYYDEFSPNYKKDEHLLYIEYTDKEGKLRYSEIYGYSIEECYGKFFINNTDRYYENITYEYFE